MKKYLDDLLGFSMKLGEQMIRCGANIERVSDTVYRICESYHCQNIQFFALDCYLTLSLTDAEGEQAAAQRCIRGGTSIHMEQLGRLNQLSRQICAHPPAPGRLDGMLEETISGSKSYSPGQTLLFTLFSAACLTGIYGGSPRDLSIILLNCVLAFLSGRYLKKLIFNKIIYNVMNAFLVGAVAIFFARIGYLDGYHTVMIVNSLKLIPGIPMVNSFRNLLSGNEINGTLELLKLLFETAAIAGGFLLSTVFLPGTTP
ncbi:MAG: threonine/serine exporter family protein [Lachnospiraceae bacterium]|nr:threonine/serine exporter family protein [Lachnospiraceae bacterium]